MKICRISRLPLKEHSRKYPQREYHILERLKKKGHSVNVHTTTPLKPLPGRYLSYGCGALMAIISFRKNRADVILADNMESALMAIFIKLFFRVPLVLDFIDDYSLIARYDGLRLRYLLLRILEKTMPKFADKVIVVDKHKMRFSRNLGVKENKIILIPNGTDTNRFRPDLPSHPFLQELKKDMGKIILFVGKMNKYYNVDILIKAFPLVLKNTQIAGWNNAL